MDYAIHVMQDVQHALAQLQIAVHVSHQNCSVQELVSLVLISVLVVPLQIQLAALHANYHFLCILIQQDPAIDAARMCALNATEQTHLYVSRVGMDRA